MIKLVFGSKNKIIKHQKRSFQELREVIKANFPEAPIDYCLSYIDEEKDQICLNSDQDLSHMLKSKAKTYKVYIKQSLTQTIVVDLDTTIKLQNSSGFSLTQQLKKGQAACAEPFKQNSREIQPKAEQKFIQPAKKEPRQEGFQQNEKQNNAKSCSEVKNQRIQQIIVQFKEGEKQQEESLQLAANKPQVKQAVAVKLQISDEKRVISSLQERNKKDDHLAQEKPIHMFFEQIEEVKPSQKKEEILQVHGVICSNCKDQFGILGVRYQCILCNFFNLCSKCQGEIEHQHALLKVKIPNQAITEKVLVQKFRKQIYELPKEKEIPVGYFIPSIEKDEAYRILNSAKVAYQEGKDKVKHLMQQLFVQMETSYKNPYEAIKPLPKKTEKPTEKAQYLSDLVGISYNEAFRFVNKYPTLDKERITETYFRLKK